MLNSSPDSSVPANSSLDALLKANNEANAKSRKKANRKAAKREKYQKVWKKDKKTLAILAAGAACWIGISAAMESFKQVSNAGANPAKTVATSNTGTPNLEALLLAKSKQNAQNIASVSASATAAGSPAQTNANGLDEAISMLVGEGVNGAPGTSFASIKFKVPYLDAAAITAAKQHLHWNKNGWIEFVQPPREKESRSGGKTEKIAQ